jgi:hypothetical protein
LYLYGGVLACRYSVREPYYFVYVYVYVYDYFVYAYDYVYDYVVPLHVLASFK